ncbi:MAG: SIR2 family protein [Vicinamibacterales bacterium]
MTQVDGNVQARFIEQEGAQSTSEREILGIATMLFAEATVGAEVMLFSYNEDVIDAQMRPHIWRFFSEDLPASRFSPWGVIVLVQMSEFVVPVHCANGTGLFAYLKDGGLQRRQRWSAAEPLLRAIAHVSQSPDRHIVFFLGAGASVSSGLLLGDGLRDKALEGLVGRDEQVEMIRKFRNFTREHDRELPDEAARSDSEFAATLTLERVMREELRLHGIEHSPTLDSFLEQNNVALTRPGRAIVDLRKLAAKIAPRTVLVTVNFDTLLESDPLIQPIASQEDFEGFADSLKTYLGGPAGTSKIPLLKLHGTIEDRMTINASVEDTSALAGWKTAALRALMAQMPNATWVYVGYSMRDQDVTDFLRLDEVGKHVKEWWVSPFADEVCRRFGQRRWPDDPAAFEGRRIDVSADVFFNSVLTLVQPE